MPDRKYDNSPYNKRGHEAHSSTSRVQLNDTQAAVCRFSRPHGLWTEELPSARRDIGHEAFPLPRRKGSNHELKYLSSNRKKHRFSSPHMYCQPYIFPDKASLPANQAAYA